MYTVTLMKREGLKIEGEKYFRVEESTFYVVIKEGFEKKYIY